MEESARVDRRPLQVVKGGGINIPCAYCGEWKAYPENFPWIHYAKCQACIHRDRGLLEKFKDELAKLKESVQELRKAFGTIKIKKFFPKGW